METPKPNNIDIALARRIIYASISGESSPLDVELAGGLSAELIEAENRRRLLPINPHLRSRAVWTLACLAKDGEIDKEAADRFIEKLKSQGTVTPIARSTANLQTPIEEVVMYARTEVENIVEFERSLSALPDLNTLTALEKAVYNLEAINSWISRDSWLYEYFVRNRKQVMIHRPLRNYVRKGLLAPLLVFSPIVWNYDVLFFNHTGLNLDNESLALTITPGLLEDWYDRGDRWLIKSMGNLDRGKVASKILMAIKI